MTILQNIHQQNENKKYTQHKLHLSLLVCMHEVDEEREVDKQTDREREGETEKEFACRDCNINNPCFYSLKYQQIKLF